MSATEANAEAAIRALFARYAEAFDDADADAVTSLFAWPATIWQFDAGHVFQDADDLAENIEALLEVFDAAGIVVTTPDIRDIRVADAAAFAAVAWRQDDQAGEAVHEFTCSYLLIERDGDWRIATVVNEAAD